MIKNLILSGGAFRCCSHIGCIKYLEEQNALLNIDTFIGTSAGAIVAFGLSLGMQYVDLVKAIDTFVEMQNECPPDIDEMLNLYYSMGISNGNVINKFVNTLIHKYTNNTSMTFLEFAKFTGKNLVVYAAKLPNLESVYFSVDTTPDQDVATAIRASCSLPVVFTPVRIQDDYYIDGGIIQNFPFDYVKDNKLKDTLGIHIKGGLNKLPRDMNIISFVRIVLNSIMKRANATYGEKPDCLTIVSIVQEENDSFNLHFDLNSCTFNIPETKVQDYIEIGYNRIKEMFEASSP